MSLREEDFMKHVLGPMANLYKKQEPDPTHLAPSITPTSTSTRQAMASLRGFDAARILQFVSQMHSATDHCGAAGAMSHVTEMVPI